MGRRIKRRQEEIERDLPPRLRCEPKAGDNPLKRPYPEHFRDMEILADLLDEIKEPPKQNDFSQRDLRIIFRPHGILFFHALDIQDLKLSRNNFVKGSPFCVYVELECQDTAKCSDPVYSVQTNKVRIDHSIHMSIDLSETRTDEKNDFLMHIYAFQDPEAHYLIGSQVIHLYEFVREIHGIITVTMVSDLSFHVGKFTFEFAWSYGSYGYGFSNQLYNPKNPILESISHSMFPRIALSPNDLLDNRVNARIPKKLRLVTLHSLLVRQTHPEDEEAEKTTLQLKKSVRKHAKDKSEFEAKTVVFRRVKFNRGNPVHVSLNLDIHQKFMEDDFNQAYGEYICLRNRKDRLEWLGRLIEGRLRDRVEYDTGELLTCFEDVKDARRALSTKRPLACPPSYLEQNFSSKAQCSPIAPSKVEEEDIKFIHEKLASAPRFQGYLSYVFGYDKAPPKEERMEDFEYKLDEKAAKHIGQQVKDGRHFCTRCCSVIPAMTYFIVQWFIWLFKLIFPSFKTPPPPELPEISITLPSPQHSTTDFHSFCSQRQVYQGETDLEATKRRARIYLTMSRKGITKNENDDDWVDEEEGLTLPTKQFLGEKSTGLRKERKAEIL